MENRISALLNKIQDAHVDGLLVLNTINIAYLSGFRGSFGVGLVTPNKRCVLVDGRYLEQAGDQAAGWQVERLGDEWLHTVAARVKGDGIRRLAFEAEHISFARYRELEAALEGVALVPAVGWVEEIRAVKDKCEIRAIRKAVELTEATLSRVVGEIRPGMTEHQVAAKLENTARELGAEATAFRTIVVSGPRTSLPHGTPTHRVLEPGDLLTIDFGVMVDGYCSDTTRTYAVGSVSARQRDIYQAVLDAHLEAAAAIRPGMTGAQAYAIARTVLEKHGLAEAFVHGLGHGVGLQVHELPRLGQSKQAQAELKVGMVVTIEPGVYIEKWGGVRIEDLYVIGENGVVDLNKLSKELVVLG